MVEQLGGSLIGPDGSYIWNTEAWEKALSFMSQWGPLGNNYGSPTLKNARSLFNFFVDFIFQLLFLFDSNSRFRQKITSFYVPKISI